MPSINRLPSGTVSYNNTMGLQWENQVALQRFYAISANQQRQPDAIDLKRGGKAWWRNPKGRTGVEFRSISVCDSHTTVFGIRVHTEVIRLSMWLNLREEVRSSLQDIIPCASYSALQHVISVDTECYNHAIILLAIIKLWNDNKVTCAEAEEYRHKWVQLVDEEYTASSRLENSYSAPAYITDIFERYLQHS
jgi:hypothetical protein